jgi:hypothetical protein
MTIGDQAFSGCKSLGSISIPDSVTSIGKSAFEGCKSLGSIDIPDSVMSIGNSAFYGCKSLGSIDIPESVTTIGNRAFYGCESLGSISIPDGVTSIGDAAFYGCKSLGSISIPESVTTIGIWAFDGCKSLATVLLPEAIEREEEFLRNLWKSSLWHRLAFYASVLTQKSEVLKKMADLEEAVLAKKEELLDFSIQHNMSLLFVKLIDFLGKPCLEELSKLEERVLETEGFTEFKAIFLQYKNENYTPEEIEAFERKKCGDLFD